MKPSAAKSKAAPDWQQFQELVARIEESLAPKGAKVASPDRVRDLQTGRMREVDASIRFQVGTTPILITVECRKRGRVQDDTWIEQLATKRAKIGAAKTIAVSSKGFSESAIKTAALHGIELRSLKDRIGEEIVSRFLSGLRVLMLVTDYRARTVAFITQDGSSVPPEDFSPALKQALASGSMDTPIAHDRGTGASVTLNSLIRRADDYDVPENGPAVVKHLAATFKSNRVVVETTSGDRFLRRIELAVEFKKHSKPAPTTALYEYASPDQVFRRTVEATAAIGDQEMQLHVDIASEALDGPTAPPQRSSKRS